MQLSFTSFLIGLGALMMFCSFVVAVACLIGGAMRPDPDFGALDAIRKSREIQTDATQYIPAEEIAEACIEASRALEEVHRLTCPNACGPEVYLRLMTPVRPDCRLAPVAVLNASLAPVMRSLRDMAVAADPAALVEVP